MKFERESEWVEKKQWEEFLSNDNPTSKRFQTDNQETQKIIDYLIKKYANNKISIKDYGKLLSLYHHDIQQSNKEFYTEIKKYLNSLAQTKE